MKFIELTLKILCSCLSVVCSEQRRGQHLNNIFTNYCIATFFTATITRCALMAPVTVHVKIRCCALSSPLHSAIKLTAVIWQKHPVKRCINVRYRSERCASVLMIGYCKKTALGAKTITNTVNVRYCGYFWAKEDCLLICEKHFLSTLFDTFYATHYNNFSVLPNTCVQRFSLRLKYSWVTLNG